MVEAAPETEQTIRAMQPCRMALAGTFALWVYVLALGVFWILYKPPMMQKLDLTQLREWAEYVCLWGIGILVPGVILWQSRVRLWYFAGAVAIVLIAGALRYWQPNHSFGLENVVLIIVGSTGIGLTELFRRGHHYAITTGRLSIKVEFLTDHQRQLLFSKINDVVVQRGILGRIFGFGNVIPITASGLGTGSDFAFYGGAVAGKVPLLSRIAVAAFLGGGRSVTLANGRSDVIFFGVERPDTIVETVFELMKTREAVYRAPSKAVLDSARVPNEAEAK